MPRIEVKLEDIRTGRDLDMEIEIDQEDVKVLGELEAVSNSKSFDYVMNLIAEDLNVSWRVV